MFFVARSQKLDQIAKLKGQIVDGSSDGRVGKLVGGEIHKFPVLEIRKGTTHKQNAITNDKYHHDTIWK